jgi:hypothetical protein
MAEECGQIFIVDFCVYSHGDVGNSKRGCRWNAERQAIDGGENL